MQEAARAARAAGLDVVAVDPGGALGDLPPWARGVGPEEAAGLEGPCLVLVPDVAGALQDPTSPLGRALARLSAPGSGCCALMGASASDLTRLVSLPWGQRLASRSAWLWVGDGIGQQFAIRVSNPALELRLDLGEGGGWVVRRGRARAAKLVCLPDGAEWE